MTSIERYEKIEDYLMGRLSEEDRRAFESQIETDDELAAEVELHRDLIEATGDQEMIDFRQQLDTIAEEVAPAGKSAGRGHWRTLLLAGLLVVAGLAAWWWMSSGTDSEETVEVETSVGEEPSTADEMPAEDREQEGEEMTDPKHEAPPTERSGEQEESSSTDQEAPPIAEEKTASRPDYKAIAMANYDVPNLGVVTKGGETEEAPSTLEQAQQAFKEEDYQKVVSLLSDTPSKQQEEWRYTRAHAYFQTGAFEQAAADFTQLTNSFNYGYDSDWNLLLALAAQWPDSREAFEKQFAKVSKKSHPYAERAQNLKGAIEEAANN